MFKAIKRDPDGDEHTIIFEELCHKAHGKMTEYTMEDEIHNNVFRNGGCFAHKKVQAHEAFFTKEGKIQTADRADWKSFTKLKSGKEW